MFYEIVHSYIYVLERQKSILERSRGLAMEDLSRDKANKISTLTVKAINTSICQVWTKLNIYYTIHVIVSCDTVKYFSMSVLVRSTKLIQSATWKIMKKLLLCTLRMLKVPKTPTWKWNKINTSQSACGKKNTVGKMRLIETILEISRLGFSMFRMSPHEPSGINFCDLLLETWSTLWNITGNFDVSR